MGKRERIRELETEFRLLYNELYIVDNKSGFHAHHNKKFIRCSNIISELERISLKYKLKKLIRRIFKNG